jgi:hypothetical protein
MAAVNATHAVLPTFVNDPGSSLAAANLRDDISAAHEDAMATTSSEYPAGNAVTGEAYAPEQSWAATASQSRVSLAPGLRLGGLGVVELPVAATDTDKLAPPAMR